MKPIWEDGALMRIHELKCRFYHLLDIANGEKRAEVRKDDRHYMVGDILSLREVDEFEGTFVPDGLQVDVRVTHVLRDAEFPEGLRPGYAVLSFEEIKTRWGKEA